MAFGHKSLRMVGKYLYNYAYIYESLPDMYARGVLFRVVATSAAPQFTSNYPHPHRISYGLPATHKYPLPTSTHKYKYLLSTPIAWLDAVNKFFGKTA